MLFHAMLLHLQTSTVALRYVQRSSRPVYLELVLERDSLGSGHKISAYMNHYFLHAKCYWEWDSGSSMGGSRWPIPCSVHFRSILRVRPQKVAKGTIVTTGSDVTVALCSSGHEQKEYMTACGAVQSEICAASHTWAALVKTACVTPAVHCKQPVGKEAEDHEEGVIRNVNKPTHLSLCSVARQPYVRQDSNLGHFHPQHQTQHILLWELPTPQKSVSAQQLHGVHILDSIVYRNLMHRIRHERKIVLPVTSAQ